MCLTVCLACDKTYSDNKKQCPHCFTTNFFADPDDKVVASAIYVLIDEMKHEGEKTAAQREKDRQEKLQELQRVRGILIPRKPWYVRLYRYFFRKAA